MGLVWAAADTAVTPRGARLELNAENGRGDARLSSRYGLAP
jgi:hypothetical protein